MKCFSMASVTSKSAITPSFMGLMALMLSGVRPNIFFASAPTVQVFTVAGLDVCYHLLLNECFGNYVTGADVRGAAPACM